MQQMDAETAQERFGSVLYDRFALPIFTYLCQQVANEQDAEDLLLPLQITPHITHYFNSINIFRPIGLLYVCTFGKEGSKKGHRVV